MREKRVRNNAGLRIADNKHASFTRKTLFGSQQDARAKSSHQDSILAAQRRRPDQRTFNNRIGPEGVLKHDVLYDQAQNLKYFLRAKRISV
jgi:hypothetical protein